MKNLTINKKIVFAILIVFIIVSVSIAFSSEKALGILPFGGQILNVLYCICSNNLLITVGPPVGGQYIFQPGASMLYPFGQIFRAGPWVLGNASPGGVCLIWAGKICVPAGFPMGTIIGVGTSL